MSEKEIALAALSQATDQDLKDYKTWLNLPSELGASPYFSASNRMNWVKVDNSIINAQEPRTEARHEPSKPQPSKRPSAEVIEISDDDEPAPPRKKRVQHNIKEPKVEPKVEPLSTPIPPTTAPKVTKKFSKDGRILISARESVEKVVLLKEIPGRMPVSDTDTAYIFDFSDSDSRIARSETYRGKPKNLDRVLKHEDQDSWGLGTNGSTARETKLTILGDLPSRRSTHFCKGGFRCEFFDLELLDGYERDDPDDMTLTQHIFARELKQSKNDSGTSAAVTASFFRYVQKKTQCDLAGCSGKPVLKRRRNGPSDAGKELFVGCSDWRKAQEYSHTYISIPSGVGEIDLGRLMDGEPVEDVDEDEQPSCSRLMHPRHAKQRDCPHTHFRDGKLVVGHMVPHSCPVKKIVYTSQDLNVKMLVVIFRGRHSHPPWPAEKPNLAAKEDLEKCLTSMGTIGATGGRLNNSATTKAILGSDLAVKHPAFRNKRRLRDAVLSRKDSSTPTGLLWAGILDKYEQDLELSPDLRYIHIIRMEEDLKVAVTMDSFLANLVHEVQYLVPDFTFKRIKGLLNEWEVAVWLDEEKERVSITRVYCNKATAMAFFYIFDGFFMAIKQVTGRPVRFKAFDPEGNIISINFDMEAAQVQGFAMALLKLLGETAPETDPDIIVRYVVKLCTVHFTRSTDALVGAVGQATVDYLNRIRGLKRPEDIEAWHKFCREHPNKKLRDWYEHKIRYSWLLPGYNESLSLFPPGFWDRTPHHTNLVESAHVATNRETGTLLSPLEAIQKARAFDADRAAAIIATRETCILSNHNNSDQSRMSRAVGRQKTVQKRRAEHTSVENGLSEAVKELREISDAKKAAAARVKELKEEKKSLGRAPRNIHLGDKDGNAARIPKVSSSTPIAVEAESDIEMVEDSGGWASEPDTSAVSRASSPPRSGVSDYDESDVDAFSFMSDFGAASAPASESEWENGLQDSEYEDGYGLQGPAAAEPEDVPHFGHYLLGAPGFDLDEFLAACDYPN
ncbi:hypothetical protein FB451DRAFT_1434374 [Mycena latifolia]|nr:hypothetical protein FB451DRAFT_1434374 [Mycena latifolia]